MILSFSFPFPSPYFIPRSNPPPRGYSKPTCIPGPFLTYPLYTPPLTYPFQFSIFQYGSLFLPLLPLLPLSLAFPLFSAFEDPGGGGLEYTVQTGAETREKRTREKNSSGKKKDSGFCFPPPNPKKLEKKKRKTQEERRRIPKPPHFPTPTRKRLQENHNEAPRPRARCEARGEIRGVGILPFAPLRLLERQRSGVRKNPIGVKLSYVTAVKSHIPCMLLGWGICCYSGERKGKGKGREGNRAGWAVGWGHKSSKVDGTGRLMEIQSILFSIIHMRATTRTVCLGGRCRECVGRGPGLGKEKGLGRGNIVYELGKAILGLEHDAHLYDWRVLYS